MESDEKVKVVISGSGMKEENGNLYPLCILSYSETFTEAVAFGKFVANIPRVVERSSDKNYEIFIPRKARNTWSVKRIEGGNPDLFLEWSKKFAISPINSKDLHHTEILSYWLKLTGDENIRRSLLRSSQKSE